MDEADQGDLIERIVRAGAGTGYQVEIGPVWLKVTPERADPAEHGWKLHVSARAAAYAALVERLLPVIVREGCAFKLARSQRVLSELNDGLINPASVGKAVTIYPAQQRVRALGLQLAEVLSGLDGPRILSDRRVRASAPVYYRYGPFAGRWESDPRGQLGLPLRGPGGERFDGAATLAYRQPVWATDPFTGQAGQGEPGAAGPEVLGGRYRITAGIYQSARGNVYRAIDQGDGGIVIVKQARALVGEDAAGADTRARLRNERRILQAVEGMAGVPRFLDHFRHGDDEFLVTSDCGGVTLNEDVSQNGPYRAGTAHDGPRDLGKLAQQLAGIVAGLHDRGVIICDLSPKNVVIGGEQASIIDFGIAAYQGLHLPGATPGYAPPRQQHGDQPGDADDYYALGMTLLFAATGLHPVAPDQDLEVPRIRALQTIRSAYGPAPAGVIGAVTDLIGTDPDRARASFWCLARGQLTRPAGHAARLPAIPAMTPELAAEVTAGLLSDLLEEAGDIGHAGLGGPAAPDASIYSGSAGIGLELLHHTSDRGATSIVGDLVAFTWQASRQVQLPPALFVGHTGVRVFAWQAAYHGITTAASGPATTTPDLQWQPEGVDLISGTAGVGLGNLWLYHASGDHACLEVARQCLTTVLPAAAPDPPPQAGPPPDALATGRAHGLAGLTGFLLAMAEHDPSQRVLAAADRSAQLLADRTRALITQARRPDAAPLSVSWCRGLAGIGPVLLHASALLGDRPLTRLARQAADACISYLPRVGTLGRCCGAAGIGSFLIDLAIQEQDQQYWDAAHDVAVHMLLRSAGPPGHLTISHPVPAGTASWASGLTGLLSFFRRLARPGQPDCLPLNPFPATRQTAPLTALP